MSPSSSGALPFSAIFTRAFNGAFSRHLRVVFLLSVIAGLVTAIPQSLQFGLLASVGGQEGEIASSALLVFLPIFFLVALLVGFFGLLVNVGFMVIAVKGTNTIAKTLRGAWFFVLRFLGISIWILIRTFAWVPLIGYGMLIYGVEFQETAVVMAGILVMLCGLFPMVYYGPYFFAAHFIALRDKKGVRESVNLSYERTQGYWGKIVGNCLLMSLCIWVIALVIGVLTAVVLAIPAGMMAASQGGVGASDFLFLVPLLALLNIGSTLLSAFPAFFMVELAHTILAHPRKR